MLSLPPLSQLLQHFNHLSGTVTLRNEAAGWRQHYISQWLSRLSVRIQPTMEQADLYPSLPKDGSFIRLLTVHAGAKEDSIRCTLYSASLQQKLHYEALSYTWNMAGTPRSIQINNTPREVNENLWQILSHVRLACQDRTIWVDALSIRQDDINEKSAQVRMIHLTFQQAIRVLVWLGMPADDSDFVFDELRRAAKEGESYSLQGQQARMGKAWLALVNRPYWGRTWIVQEIYLARDLHFLCGDAFLTKQEFSSGHVNVRHVSEYPGPMWPEVHAARIIEYIHEVRVMGSIFDVLENHYETKCLDIRDRVFALQNMLRKGEQEAIIVPADYNLSHEELFLKVIKAWESVIDLSSIRKVLGALDLTWPRILAFLNNKKSNQLEFPRLKVGATSVLPVAYVWSSPTNPNYRLFNAVRDSQELQFITTYPIRPLQKVVQLGSKKSEANVRLGSSVCELVAILCENVNGNRWSLHSALTLHNVGYMQSTQFNGSELAFLADNFFHDSKAIVQGSGRGSRTSVNLKFQRLAQLGMLATSERDQTIEDTILGNHDQSQSLAIKWKSTDEKSLVPVLTFANGETCELNVEETAPDDFMEAFDQRKKVVRNRGLGRLRGGWFNQVARG